MTGALANSADTDQTPHHAASDLCQHCLHEKKNPEIFY